MFVPIYPLVSIGDLIGPMVGAIAGLIFAAIAGFIWQNHIRSKQNKRWGKRYGRELYGDDQDDTRPGITVKLDRLDEKVDELERGLDDIETKIDRLCSELD